MILSQPEQEWLWHPVSACSCEILAYYNFCSSWSSWKQCIPCSSMSACLKDCHRTKFCIHSTTPFLFSGQTTVLIVSKALLIAVDTHSLKCRGLRLNNLFEGFQHYFSPKPHWKCPCWTNSSTKLPCSFSHQHQILDTPSDVHKH